MASSMSSDLLLPGGCHAKKDTLYVQKPWTPVRKRMPIVAEYSTPGPDSMPMCFFIGRQVMNSSIIHQPAWSLHPRIEQKINHYQASPNSYCIRNLTARGGKTSTPQYTMGIKPKNRPIQDLPGPASYKTKSKLVLKSAPCFTFRTKPEIAATFKTPAPNEYTLPTIHHHTPPAHHMAHRLSVKVPVETPGPGAYSLSNKTLPHAPQYTIRERLFGYMGDELPGPGSYCPERVIVNLPVAPRQTMGIKHSPYAGIWHPRIVGPRHC
ncbi:outer dense fiber protein 3-like isoform X2 [Thrips palmi]|uniref:Outer dense fiber protein 3-like isoform X2 n=1 Tax=Thrips palmi TaxID=161013 RepID=A0A6P8ZX24_THRPL|nr:outer dense fiber protein 3-like isoform X2 [Thrips palmi]